LRRKPRQAYLTESHCSREGFIAFKTRGKVYGLSPFWFLAIINPER
jgi:hypothetical protein